MEGTVSPLPPICPRSSEKNAHILVGVTGSVAALKLPLLVEELLKIPGTCAIRAWDGANLCSSHPITARQIPCIVKKLAGAVRTGPAEAELIPPGSSSPFTEWKVRERKVEKVVCLLRCRTRRELRANFQWR
uniref:Phosphopantothenoylcysteine decarboxylase n=1 Tax=Naja naja TaxID=35670 RepID=A0A8C7E497_NAJNA